MIAHIWKIISRGLECKNWTVDLMKSISCLLVSDSMQPHGLYPILQTRILEWVAVSFPRASSWPRYWTWVSCIAGRFFTIWATKEAQTVGESENINRVISENKSFFFPNLECLSWTDHFIWSISGVSMGSWHRRFTTSHSSLL